MVLIFCDVLTFDVVLITGFFLISVVLVTFLVRQVADLVDSLVVAGDAPTINQNNLIVVFVYFCKKDYRSYSVSRHRIGSVAIILNSKQKLNALNRPNYIF